MVIHKLSSVRYPVYYRGNLSGFAIGFENKADVSSIVVGDWYPLIQVTKADIISLLYTTTTAALTGGTLKYALINPETEETIVTDIYQDLDIATAKTRDAATPKTGLMLYNKVLGDILPSQSGWVEKNWDCLTLCVSITGAASIPDGYGLYFNGIIGS